jgi:pilus assembly protein CpaF
MSNIQSYQQLKRVLHKEVLEEVDLESVHRLDEETGRDRLSPVIRELIRKESTPLTHPEREQLVREILDELFGLGPLEPLLEDSMISDILVNGSQNVFVERQGLIERTNVVFTDDEHLMQVIDRIVSRVGRRVDESSPMVDARLSDGSRVNVIIPPLSLDGPILSIRRFTVRKLAGEELVENGTLGITMLELLKAAVQGKRNILISGGTGAGKTTLLNILSSFIGSGERIITIEDSAELQLQQEHVVHLETRPPNVEGTGAIAQRQLVINSLRMRPDRIVVGEVRGEEAIDMLQAMNTGHEGSMTTVHANSPRDALSRIETMVFMAHLNLSERAIRQQVASALDVVVQISRLSDGTRKVMSIQEVVGMEGDMITMQDLYNFERRGVDADNKVLGDFRFSGIRPQFSEQLRAAGIALPLEMSAGNQLLEM